MSKSVPPPVFLEVGQAPSTFSQITALVCVGQRAYLRVPCVPAKPLVHRQSHFDTKLGPLPPTATAHCCCTHTCEYMCMHESGWLGLGQCKQHQRCPPSVTQCSWHHAYHQCWPIGTSQTTQDSLHCPASDMRQSTYSQRPCWYIFYINVC